MQGMAPTECVMLCGNSPSRRPGVPHPIPWAEGQGLGPRVSVVFDPLLLPSPAPCEHGAGSQACWEGSGGEAALWTGLKA